MKNMSVFIIALALISMTILNAADFKKEYHEKFNVSKGMVLNLKSGDGDVILTPWGQDEVQVDIVYHANHSGNGDKDRSFEVEFDLTSRALHIIAHERTGSRFGISSRHIYQYIYDIKAPAYLLLDLDGDDGNMQVSGWENNIEITLGDGDLELSDIKNEETYLRIGDGDLKINKLVSDISIWADDGDVDLSEISATRCRLEINDGTAEMRDISGNYNIRFDDGDVKLKAVKSDQIDIRGKDGRIELELMSAENPDIMLETDDGPVRLFMHADISAELSIETDDGDFSVNLPGETRAKEGRNWYQSQIKDGKGQITIRTNDGSVRVREI